MEQYQMYTIFEFVFNDEELENNIHKFFNRNGLTPLFNNEWRATHIRVSYAEAKSTTNKGGAIRRKVLNFADLLSVANDNKKYEEALFRILDEARSMQGLANILERISTAYYTTFDEDDKKYLWNIVFYSKNGEFFK